MAKRIRELNETNSALTDKYFVIDSIAKDGKTEKVSFSTLKAALMPTENNCITTVNGNTWVRRWSDGWCEQGGYIATTAGNGKVNTVTLPVAMRGKYFIQLTRANPTRCGYPQASANLVQNSEKPTQFQFISVCGSSHTSVYWEVKGFSS